MYVPGFTGLKQIARSFDYGKLCYLIGNLTRLFVYDNAVLLYNTLIYVLKVGIIFGAVVCVSAPFDVAILRVLFTGSKLNRTINDFRFYKYG